MKCRNHWQCWIYATKSIGHYFFFHNMNTVFLLFHEQTSKTFLLADKVSLKTAWWLQHTLDMYALISNNRVLTSMMVIKHADIILKLLNQVPYSRSGGSSKGYCAQKTFLHATKDSIYHATVLKFKIKSFSNLSLYYMFLPTWISVFCIYNISKWSQCSSSFYATYIVFFGMLIAYLVCSVDVLMIYITRIDNIDFE
jgi:hypothetical protein